MSPKDETVKNPSAESATTISDQALPGYLDYSQLKQAGLSHLQEINSHVWSNYNETDPGVTILEQLCYALTELGYCTDFPITDLLTGEDGKIAYHNQFFEAAAILSSAPITISDYQKLIFDKYPQVLAIYIQAETVLQSAQEQYTGRYQTSLVLYPAPIEQQQQVAKAVSTELNQHRNLAECFLPAKILQARAIALQARVHLQQASDAASVQAQIFHALQQFVLPRPVAHSFQVLQQQGWSGDQIINGPRLQNGWIAERQPLQANLVLRLTDLNKVIASVPGVAMLEGLRFSEDPQLDYLALSADQYASFYPGSDFLLFSNQSQVQADAYRYQGELQLNLLKSNHLAQNVNAKVELLPKLPAGQFRDIESYYSIQNTFPEIYAIGHNSLESDAPSYRVAAARQLKAYLLVYDQLLANQFSQLAHLGDLFAFTPKSKSRKKTSEWPEQQDFAQTYYTQTLYTVPDVRNLLRGCDQFAYEFDTQKSQSLRERQSWRRFVEFAYNEYAYGLHKASETQDDAEQRREMFLNHLLARQGYDCHAYDAVLQAGAYYGTARRSRIIKKTVWLQNEQLLSYHRYQGFDWAAARQIQDLASYEKQQILAASQPRKTTTDSATVSAKTPAYPEINGQIDLTRIWAQHKLRSQDLADYASLECRLDQILNLRPYLLQLADALESVLQDAVFMQWLLRDPQKVSQIYLPAAQLYLQAQGQIDVVCASLELDTQQLVRVAGALKERATADDYRKLISQLRWLAEQRHGLILIETILLLNDTTEPDASLAPYFQNVVLIFPDYVWRFGSTQFQANLQFLLRQFMPLHLDLEIKLCSANLCKALIQAYTLWHNHQHSPALKQNYARQIQRLLQLPELPGAGHG